LTSRDREGAGIWREARFARSLTVAARLALGFALSGCQCGGPQWLHAVRQPAFAGQWYPRDPQVLDSEITRLLAAAPPPLDGKVRAIVAPHAALGYSGKVAAAAFRSASGSTYERVILLASSEEDRFDGAALPDVEKFGTPLGAVTIDRKAVDDLARIPGFRVHAAAFDDEFEVENQLPWLRKLFAGARLVPVVLGQISPERRASVAASIATLADDGTLVVASTVLSSFGPGSPLDSTPWDQRNIAAMEEHTRRFDAETMALLTDRRLDPLRQRLAGSAIAACAPVTVEVFAEMLGPWEGRVVAYDTSGSYDRATHQTLDGFIGYGAVAFLR
jgi:MEMO1 family protein